MAIEGAFAVIRSGPSGLGQIETMSRGGIAIAIFKSKPIRMGQIIQNCTMDRCSGQDRRQFNDPEDVDSEKRNGIERRKSLQWG